MRKQTATLLHELGAALARMHRVLEAEMPGSSEHWKRMANEVSMFAQGGDVEAGRLATTISNSLGHGMGSLRDTYLGDDFEQARDDVEALLAKIATTTRSAGGIDRPTVRTLLVGLELALLDAGAPQDASAIRALFTEDELNYTTILDAVARLQASTWPADHDREVRAILTQLLSALTPRSGTTA
ncbi:MAG: hypothetical protein R3B06_27950 [Kofleriaceae bacterium]